jgi:hypothetical protein
MSVGLVIVVFFVFCGIVILFSEVVHLRVLYIGIRHKPYLFRSSSAHGWIELLVVRGYGLSLFSFTHSASMVLVVVFFIIVVIVLLVIVGQLCALIIQCALVQGKTSVITVLALVTWRAPGFCGVMMGVHGRGVVVCLIDFQGVYIVVVGASDGCGVCHVEFLDEVRAISLCCCLPAIVCCGVSFPSEQVLQLAVASNTSGSEYLFYFIFWLVID